MKQSMTKQTLIETAKQIKEEKFDIITPLDNIELSINPTGRLEAQVKNVAKFEELNFLANKQAEKNVATMLGINGYFFRLQEEQPDLLQRNVVDRLEFIRRESDKSKMLRTVKDTLRSVHSASYLPIDSSDILQTVVETSESHGLVIRSAHIDHDNMFVKMTSDKLQNIGIGDDLRFGLCISNNDNGNGRLSVMPFVERLVCTNGMVVKDFMCEYKRTHRGCDKSESTPYIYNLTSMPWSDRERKKEMLEEIKKTIDRAMESDSVQKIMDKIKESKEKQILDVEKTLEGIDKITKLSNEEKGEIESRFNGETDKSLWSLVNAITRTAQDSDSYERATELESLGGSVLTGKLRLVA